jgi:D-lactate dehydrogenase
LRSLFDYHGIDTCAACGLCATACPVGIEAGALMKSLRGRRAGAVAHAAADTVAGHFEAATRAVRAGLGAADLLHALVGTRLMTGSLDALRAASGGRLPKWSPAMPRPAAFVRRRQRPASTAERIVYFPSCAARTMGPARGDDFDALPDAAARLFAKAGYGVVYPERIGSLCCGQPFESKGMFAAADGKSAELEAALRDASEGGRLPIVFDTSPCAFRMRRFCGERLPVHDVVEFIHDRVLARVRIVQQPGSVAVHPVCSVRKMGSVEKLAAIAARCCERVVTVPDVQCCGFAGDKGFSMPELNEHALRRLGSALPAGCTQGYSSSRTCEIGLSEQAGFPYRSIVHLVDACAAPPATAALAAD